MTFGIILIAALVVYGLFAALRGSTRIDEAEIQHQVDARMQAAQKAIDDAAAKDPDAI